MQDEILTTDDYWDCECKTDYIHSKEETFCDKCKSYSHEQPDARYPEVVTKLLMDDLKEGKIVSDTFDQTLKDLTTDLKRILTNRSVVLKGSYDRDMVYYKTMITTHEVTIGQQEIRIKKLEEQVALDKLNAQDYARTIISLEAEVDGLLEQNEIMYGYVKKYMPEATNVTLIRSADTGVVGPEDNPFSKDPTMDIPDSVPLDVQGGTPLHNPMMDCSDVLRCEICSDSKPFVPVATIPTDEYSVYLSNKATGRGMQPYPFTNPIRDIPDYSKVRV